MNIAKVTEANVTSSSLRNQLINGKEEYNHVVGCMSTHATVIRPTTKTKHPMNIYLTWTKMCIGKRQYTAVAYEMGWSVAKLYNWLHKIAYDPLSVPREIYESFANIAPRRYNCGVDQLEAMLGGKPIATIADFKAEAKARKAALKCVAKVDKTKTPGRTALKVVK